MKSVVPVMLALSCAAPATAAEDAAYAILRLRTTPEQVLLTRFPTLQTCRRELAGLKALLAEELRRPGARRFDFVSPDAVPGHAVAPPEIDGACKLSKVAPKR